MIDAANKEPHNGQIVAFRFRGEASVKVFHRTEDAIELRPTVERYPLIRVERGEEGGLEIVGVMVGSVPAIRD